MTQPSRKMASSSSSSRFVSGGTNEAPTERDEAWLAAQQELDSKALAQKLRPGEQEGGKSLYETLQANKGASPTPLPLSSCITVPRVHADDSG